MSLNNAKILKRNCMSTKFRNILALLMIFVSTAIFAQVQVSGVVKDDVGEPLAGVMVENANGVSVETNDAGQYTIEANAGEQLKFSSIGFDDKSVAVTGSTLDVQMNLPKEQTQVAKGDDVIVVAYGKTSRKDLVGAVNVVKSDDLEKQQLTTVTSALQGTTPGVLLQTASGQPGENPDIRIRGIASINASADPLIILDGAPYNGNLNSISADQVESISVLKDAASTALYGSRAANGVIVVTTKKGKKGKPVVEINAVTGFSNMASKMYDLVGAEDYMKYTWEALKNDQVYGKGKTESVAAQYATDNIIDYVGYNPYNVDTPVGIDGQIINGANLLWDTDWKDVMLRDVALRNEYGFNVSGGGDNYRYFFSGNYLKQEGLVKTSDFKRLTTRLNVEADITNRWKIGVNMAYTKSDQNFPTQSGTTYGSSMAWIYNLSNIYPLYARDENGILLENSKGENIIDYGNLGGYTNGNRPVLQGGSAYGELMYDKYQNERTTYTFNAFTEYEILKGLKYRFNFTYENYLFDYYRFNNPLYGSAASIDGRIAQERNITQSQNYINSLNYDKSIGGNHHVGVDLINEIYKYEYDELSAQGTGFLEGVEWISGTAKPENIGGGISEESMISYLARVKYDYAKKYFIEVSYRADGSSRFSPEDDRRWGDFYAVGASWLISNEKFLEDSKYLSTLKLRASYGELGNNRGIGYFPYRNGFLAGYTNVDQLGTLPSTPVDPSITWEKTASLNIGLDLGLFKDRVYFVFDYYDKRSKDLLYRVPSAPSNGYRDILKNAGEIKNYGYEFGITTKNVRTSNWEWTTSLNFSFDKNEIVQLVQDEFINGSKLWKKGNSIYDFYIEEWAGVDPADGKAMWYKNVTDATTGEVTKVTTKKYAEASRYEFGTALPDVVGGFNNYVRYKSFDINFLFNYSFGGQIYDSQYAALMSTLSSPGRQLSTDISGRWQKPGDITDIPMLFASNNDFSSRSSRFLYDNDYVRLKSLNVGYNLPKDWLEQVSLSAFRVYFQGDNLWTWQSHEGLDPEQGFSGTTDNRSNNLRTYSVGVNVTF